MIILQIVTLIENHPHKGLVCEHGLSLYIDNDGDPLLFDLGGSNQLFINAKNLNIDLSKTKKVLISHAHYDHSGGFKKLNQINNDFTLMVGKTFFLAKYKLKNEDYLYHGIPFKEEDVNKLRYVNNKDQISKNLFVVTDFKMTNNFENINSSYYLKTDKGFIIDHFDDEIALVYKSKKGLFLIVGCSHKGIINILQSVQNNFQMPIIGIIGGIHLKNASLTRQEKTILALKKYPLKLLALSHCTGDPFMEKLKKIYPNEFIYNNTGKIINID